MDNELLLSISALKKLYSGTTKKLEVRNVEPKEIVKFKEELSKKVEQSKKLKPNVNLNELYSLLIKNYKAQTVDFNTREKNNLPFILFHHGMPKNVFLYLIDKCIDFERESRLVKVLYNYFFNYSENDERIGLLNQKLLRYFRNCSIEDFRKKITRSIYCCRDTLFSEDSLERVCKLYEKQGWNSTIEAMGLITPELKKSPFVSQTLMRFFRKNEPLQKKYDIFEDLEREKFLGFIDVKPIAVSSVIRMTDKLNNGKWKVRLVTFCQSNYGDPRINRYKWASIDEDARKIFLKWLASKDLELFFRIIKETAVDSMWRYRSVFWKAYLPYVTNTWVFFGSTAHITASGIARAEGQILAFGRATGGAAANHSAFIFEIGDYVFCEWSHNGRLLIWNKNSRAVLNKIVEFGGRVISKNDVGRSDYVASYVHNGAASYRWQHDVADWIASHCNIYKTRRDWGIR